MRPIVSEFEENRVPVYPATAAVFIAKFDFQTSLHVDLRDWLLGQAKIPPNSGPSAMNLIQFTSNQLLQNSRGRPMHCNAMILIHDDKEL